MLVGPVVLTCSLVADVGRRGCCAVVGDLLLDAVTLVVVEKGGARRRTGWATLPAGQPTLVVIGQLRLAQQLREPPLRGRHVRDQEGVGVLAGRELHPERVNARGGELHRQQHRGSVAGGIAVVGNQDPVDVVTAKGLEVVVAKTLDPVGRGDVAETRHPQAHDVD